MFSNYEQFTGALVGGGTLLTAATETGYMVLQPTDVAVNVTPQGRVIRGFINATGGATAGAWTIKCRQGTGVAGTQVGLTQTENFAASATLSVPFSFVDNSSPAPGGNVYTITVTAAGSNGTANDGAVELYVPSPGGAAGE
jgi:hypothetical protein